MILLADTGFEWVAPIVQTGAVGGVLVWFMFRSEPRLKSIEMAIDRMARSILLLVIALPNATATIKEQAENIKKEIDGGKS